MIRAVVCIVALVCLGCDATPPPPPESLVQPANPPAAPIVITNHLVKVVWSPPSSGPAVTSYEIWKGTTAGHEVLVVKLPPTARAWADHTCYHRCWYKVRARNATGAGRFTVEVSASGET